MRSSLIPGVNVDRVDIGSGLMMAEKLGYGDPTSQMVIEYALKRHQRGEEAGAERTWLAEFPRDLTSWKAILAHAISTANQNANRHGPWPDGTRVRFTEEARSAMAATRGSGRGALPTPAGGADAVYTIDNVDTGLHDVILRENNERWGCAWLTKADADSQAELQGTEVCTGGHDT